LLHGCGSLPFGIPSPSSSARSFSALLSALTGFAPHVTSSVAGILSWSASARILKVRLTVGDWWPLLSVA